MASSSKPKMLTDAEWLAIERRHLDGDSISELAREFGVSKGCLSKRGVAARCAEIRAVANQLVAAEQRLEALPVGEQVNARHLANELKAISANLASAARLGSMTAVKMNSLAHKQANRIDGDADMDDDEAWDKNHESMRNVAAFTELANKSATIGLNLLAANKKVSEEHFTGNVIDITPNLIPDDPVEASKAYQRMIQGE